MPKKTKSADDRLEGIELLLAALILGRKPSTERLAKIIGMRKADLIARIGREENQE
jgi:hypothetical protein